MDFYIAKDCSGIWFFKDCPDLVKFSANAPVEWTGYPVNFGDFKDSIMKMVANNPIIDELEDYGTPIHVKITDLTVSIV